MPESESACLESSPSPNVWNSSPSPRRSELESDSKDSSPISENVRLFKNSFTFKSSEMSQARYLLCLRVACRLLIDSRMLRLENGCFYMSDIPLRHHHQQHACWAWWLQFLMQLERKNTMNKYI